MRKLILLGLVAGAAVAAVVALPAAATTPGPNGLIVYSKQVGPKYRLFTVRPDGTGEKRLRVGVKGDAINADWSPDGKSIVFEVDRENGPAFASVELVRADGTGLRELTHLHGASGQPSFTPDGRRVVFGYYNDKADVESLWSVPVTGGTPRPITPQRGVGVTDPNVSPDGKWITYVRLKKENEQQALFRVRPDGTGLRQLTPFSWEVAIKHDWSPDGKLIVLTTNADFVRPNQAADLVTIRPDGSGVKNLTQFKAGENAFAGSFSPDGKQIVFRLEQGDRYALAVVNRDGSDLRLLTKLGPGKPRFIDWGTRP